MLRLQELSETNVKCYGEPTWARKDLVDVLDDDFQHASAGGGELATKVFVDGVNEWVWGTARHRPPRWQLALC